MCDREWIAGSGRWWSMAATSTSKTVRHSDRRRQHGLRCGFAHRWTRIWSNLHIQVPICRKFRGRRSMVRDTVGVISKRQTVGNSARKMIRYFQQTESKKKMEAKPINEKDLSTCDNAWQARVALGSLWRVHWLVQWQSPSTELLLWASMFLAPAP